MRLERGDSGAVRLLGGGVARRRRRRRKGVRAGLVVVVLGRVKRWSELCLSVSVVLLRMWLRLMPLVVVVIVRLMMVLRLMALLLLLLLL